MKPYISDMVHFLQHRHAIPALLLTGSVGPLAAALISQYGFGLYPCEMCIYQRIPYGLIIVLGMVAALRANAHLPALKLAIILWLINAGLAAYHTAIEQGWVESATGCTAGSPGDGSLDALRDAILNSPLVSCADAAFVFMGLSMASWNMLLALALAGIGYYMIKQQRKNHG